MPTARRDDGADVFGQEAAVDPHALQLSLGENKNDLGMRPLADEPRNDVAEKPPEDREAFRLLFHRRRARNQAVVPPTAAPTKIPMPSEIHVLLHPGDDSTPGPETDGEPSGRTSSNLPPSGRASVRVAIYLPFL